MAQFPDHSTGKSRRYKGAAVSKKGKSDAYKLVFSGKFKEVRPLLSEEGRKRLDIVKYLEGGNVCQTNLHLTPLVYRGYSSESKSDIDAILKDKTPFTPIAPGGDPKNAKYDLAEVYPGTYVSLNRARAMNYAERHEHGLLVAFDWRVLRALYVTEDVSFDLSNDIAYETEQFTKAEENYLDQLAGPMSSHPFFMDREKDAEEEEDEILRLLEDTEEFYVVWSALFGRNNELNLNGEIGGWDWEAVHTVTRTHRIKEGGAPMSV